MLPRPREFYICPVDLYRLGNSSSPRLDHVRDRDIELFSDRNNVSMVRANNRGISLRTLEDLERMGMSGWVWKLPKGVDLLLPGLEGLKLFNDHNGHYMIVPTYDMSLDRFRSLLRALAAFCERIPR